MRVVACYFSGTDTTKTVVERIASVIAEKLNAEMAVDDFTKLQRRSTPLIFTKDDVVVLGMPVIAGRVPNLMLPYLGTIEGGGAAAVPIVLYGNRNYDDALIELTGIMKDSGMKPVGAGAFIGEHSFSTVLAAGRPDAQDLTVAEKFAENIAEKIIRRSESGDGEFGEEADFFIRGEQPIRPYYQPRDRNGVSIDIRKVKPKTSEACNDCKICVNVCPLGSIDREDVSNIKGICMKCCACIKKCPQGAKYFDDEGYLYHMHELEEMYAGTRREPEVFF